MYACYNFFLIQNIIFYSLNLHYFENVFTVLLAQRWRVLASFPMFCLKNESIQQRMWLLYYFQLLTKLSKISVTERFFIIK